MWKSVKLGEICDFEGGSQPPKKEFVYEPAEGYVRFLQIRDFKSDKNITYIPIAKKNRLCAEDDILIGRYGASVGQILSGLIGAYNVALMKTIPNEEVISKGWLHAYLTSTLFQHPLMKASSRSAQNGFSKDDIYDFAVPLPPLAEQQRIVAKLDAAFAEIDAAIEAASVQINNIDMLRQRILNGWIENNANAEDYYTVQDCINNEWFKPPFDGNHGEIHPKASDYTATGVPFIMAKDLSNGDVNLTDCKFISQEQAASLRVGFAENDDVLFTHKGTIGEVALLKCEADFVMLTPQVTAYRVIDETRVDRIFLYYLFKSAFFQNQIQQIAGIGATRAYIGITRQKQLNLCLPPIGLQQEAVRMLNSSEPHVSAIGIANTYKLEQLAKLKSAILAQELQSEAA